MDQKGKIFFQLHDLIMNQNRFHEPTMYLWIGPSNDQFFSIEYWFFQKHSPCWYVFHNFGENVNYLFMKILFIIFSCRLCYFFWNRLFFQQFIVIFKLRQFHVIGRCGDMFHYGTYLMPQLINGFIEFAFTHFLPWNATC